MSFSIGETVGAYRLTEQLGQGGMATVYKAYHPMLDRYVAIKVLHQAFNEDPNFLARFQREARVVARLEHPNIVPVYDFSQHESRPYLVMKFIEGETLKARLQRGKVIEGELLQVVEAVGAALTYAHGQGVLHRDIKPSNVILAKDGKIYLADFGLARMADSGDSSLTADRLVGTPQYISPEQALSKPDLDARTDVYSFGVMLYELVTGRVPFSADTPFAIIHDHIYSPLPLPRLVNPEVSEPLERVLLKALAKERNDRFSDIKSLVAAFKAAFSLSAESSAMVEPAVPPNETVAVPAVAPQAGFPGVQPEIHEPSRSGQTGFSTPLVPSAPIPEQARTVSSPHFPASAVTQTATASTPLPSPTTGSQPMPVSPPINTLTPPLAATPLPFPGSLGSTKKQKKRRLKPLAVVGIVVLAVVAVIALLFVLRGISQNTARRTAQPLTPAPTLQTVPGNLRPELEGAVAAWQNKDLAAATQKLEKARSLIGEDVNLFKSTLQYLESQNAYLLEAMLLLNPGRPALSEGIIAQVETMHAMLYKAAADPLSGDFLKKNIGKTLFDVAPIRYETFFGDINKARDDLNKVISNRAILSRFPEARLLQVEQMVKANDMVKARQALDVLLKDKTLPAWVNQMAQELDGTLK